jgi:hypothetical protein
MKHSLLFKKTLFSPSITILILLLCVFSVGAAGVVTGELKKWHTVTVTFDGPAASESDTTTFLNNRLNVTFTNGSKSYIVPGFFTADGNAAVSGAASGSKWRVHFCPDATGTWTYTASFRTGTNVAIDPSATAGTADATIDGANGTFNIGATDKTGPDFRGKGMLQYVGKHYLQFAETGEYFIKGGCNSPDNFFAYADFDNTTASHSYASHTTDWSAGDSLWNGKGKGILGAINYLSSVGLNSQCVRVLNRPGETGDVFPYVDSGSAPWNNPAVLKTLDCSKLDQWEIVFEHMTKKGLLINMSMAQPGNSSSFEFAEGLMSSTDPFAQTRKLFYREMIARFSHHCAVTWNIIEATDPSNYYNSDQTKSVSGQQMINFGAYIHALDPYQHPVACGTETYTWNPIYLPVLSGDTAGNINCVSVINDMHEAMLYPTFYWGQRAAKPYICFQDQVLYGVDSVTDTAIAVWRIDVLWPHLLAGGSGVEFSIKNQGRAMENFKDYEKLWNQVAIAQRFMAAMSINLMVPGNKITSGETRYPYMRLGIDSFFVVRIYSDKAKYFNMSDTTTIKPGTTFKIKWFNPRTGLYTAGGTVDSFTVSDVPIEAYRTAYGFPPGVTDWTQMLFKSNDWICVVNNSNYASGVVHGLVNNKTSSVLRIVGSRIFFTARANEHVTLALYAVNGAKVETVFDGIMGSESHTVSLEPKRLATGIYFVVLNQGGKQYREPFVKIK